MQFLISHFLKHIKFINLHKLESQSIQSISLSREQQNKNSKILHTHLKLQHLEYISKKESHNTKVYKTMYKYTKLQ